MLKSDGQKAKIEKNYHHHPYYYYYYYFFLGFPRPLRALIAKIAEIAMLRYSCRSLHLQGS